MMYKIGDRVTAVCDVDGDFETTGESGTVLEDNGITVSVEFDEYVDGHDCDGLGEYGHCLECTPSELEPANSITEREP